MTSEDDHVVEHLGEWDHGIMDPTEKEEANRSKENTYGIKQAILNAERVCATSVKKVLHKVQRGMVEALGEDVKGQVADHTGE